MGFTPGTLISGFLFLLTALYVFCFASQNRARLCASGKEKETMMSGFCVSVSHFLSVTTKNYFGLREHNVDI